MYTLNQVQNDQNSERSVTMNLIHGLGFTRSLINELIRHTTSTDEKMTDGYTNRYLLEILYEELLKVGYVF